MKKEKLNEFLDTKKSKVELANISAEVALAFEKAMFYAEKYAGNTMSENNEKDVEDQGEESDPEDLTQSEIDILQKSFKNKKLDTFFIK